MSKNARHSRRKKTMIPAQKATSKSLAIADPLKHAIAIATKEIVKGASDSQIQFNLEDSGINLKQLPPDFLIKLRGGSSFKPMPKRAWVEKKSKVKRT